MAAHRRTPARRWGSFFVEIGLKLVIIAIAISIELVACRPLPPSPAPTPTIAPSPRPTSTVRPTQPRPTPTIASGMFVAAHIYRGSLELVPADLSESDCEQPSPFDLPAEGLIQVAFVPTRICFNGELGVIDIGDRVYVAQSGTLYAAFTLIDVTDPAQPEIAGAWQWQPSTYNADLKPFRQGDRRYLAVATEASGFGPLGSEPCGVAIVDVTDTFAPNLVARYDGESVGSPDPWCDVHTVEIDSDADGNGDYLFVSSNDTSDLRVIDIRDLTSAREVNRYIHPDADGRDIFVHDSTIAGDRVYVAYWRGGLVILDKAQLESGATVTPLNTPGSIAPADFAVHHAYPTIGGDFVFIEDELNRGQAERSQLRLWDIRDLSAPKEALPIKLDVPDPLGSPHNLLVVSDRLYVGWYQEGVRVFQYDVGDPERPSVDLIFSQRVRSKREPGVMGSAYDGIWGVRVRSCLLSGVTTTCLYASDLTRGLIVLALP